MILQANKVKNEQMFSMAKPKASNLKWYSCMDYFVCNIMRIVKIHLIKCIISR